MQRTIQNRMIRSCVVRRAVGSALSVLACAVPSAAQRQPAVGRSATSSDSSAPQYPFGYRLAVDSFTAVIANRVVLDIKAPAALVWSFLPSIRKRPNVEKVPLNGPPDQVGARFDVIFRDSSGTITRHDRLEVLHWEPGVRYAAHITYLPPAPPTDIVYNVDMHETGGITHFVMDAFGTVTLPDPGTDAARVAAYVSKRREYQELVTKGYLALQRDIEAAAKQSNNR